MITTRKVSKNFGPLLALKGVSFEINRGEIVGFLGQNGAGKTTLMRILTSYLPATSGQVLIGGEDISGNSMAARRKIGYLPETPPLYPDMTVGDYLAFAARLKDVPAARMSSEIDRVLGECQLGPVRDKRIGSLSKGFKQRVGIAQAIINDPELLILDEPTSGLDPIQIIQVRKLIADLKHKRTVILSTHTLSEIEQIAQRVLIIKAGQIIADQSLDALLSPAKDRKNLLVRVRGARSSLEEAISEVPGIKLAGVDSAGDIHSLRLEIRDDIEHYNDLVEKILKAKGRLLEIKEPKIELEAVFLELNSAASREPQA